MVKKILITRPNHDIATSYLYNFSKNIVKIIKQTKDIHITNLQSKEANRKKFEKALLKEKPGLIFLNGHGNEKTVCGYKDEVILDNKNITCTKGKIVYALACDSLKDLGEEAIKQGTKSYIGYKANFMIVRDPTRINNPSKDKNALPFKKACSCLINALIFGKKVKDAIDLTKKEYIKSIQSYGTSEDDPYGDTPLIRFALAWNLEFLDAYGNQNAIFS